MTRRSQTGTGSDRGERSDRKVPSAPPTLVTGTGGGRRGQKQRFVVKGLPLKAKFMLAITATVAVGMAVLGMLMAGAANHVLFNQVQHGGVELSKMAAELSHILIERGERDENGHLKNKAAVEADLLEAFNGARTWGDSGDSFTFIDAITINYGEMSGVSVGNPQTANSTRVDRTSIDVAGRGEVALARFDDVEVASVDKVTTGGRVIPVYRFKVGLDGGAVSRQAPQVQVDIAIADIRNASGKIYTVLIIALVVMIAIAVLVGNLLAGRITRPVNRLLDDMRRVATGDLEHKTRARSNDEVGALATEFNAMTQSLNVAQSALIEQEKAKHELEIAREVQQQLLPNEMPEIEGYSMAAYYKGAKAVSGDYYDFIPLPDGLFGFIVADVSGKGVPGSMVMAVTRTIVRLVAPNHGRNAAEVLKETNKLIVKQIKRGMFVTVFYVVVDPTTGSISYAAAGHNPMGIYRASKKGVQMTQTKGIAVGLASPSMFDRVIENYEATLAPGDMCVLYTDGFPEAMNEENEEFGDDKFNACIARYGAQGPQGMIDALVNDISEHRGRAEQSDDLTILAVRRGG